MADLAMVGAAALSVVARICAEMRAERGVIWGRVGTCWRLVGVQPCNGTVVYLRYSGGSIDCTSLPFTLFENGFYLLYNCQTEDAMR